jgi:hypothetical protein
MVSPLKQIASDGQQPYACDHHYHDANYLDGDQIAWLQGMLEAQKIMMNIKTGRRVPVYRLRYQNLLPECYNS